MGNILEEAKFGGFMDAKRLTAQMETLYKESVRSSARLAGLAAGKVTQTRARPVGGGLAGGSGGGPVGGGSGGGLAGSGKSQRSGGVKGGRIGGPLGRRGPASGPSTTAGE